jgi:hypothetical protein
MSGVLIQNRQNRINALTATHIGLPFDVYRSASMLAPLAAGNKVITGLMASFAVSVPALDFRNYNKPHVPFWTAILDNAQIQIGDWLVGAPGTFYIADKQALQPIPAIQCGSVVTIARPGYVTAPGPIQAFGAVVGGTLYTDGVYAAVSLSGGSGSGAKATITVLGGSVSSVVLTSKGIGYAVGDMLSALASSIGGTGSGFSVRVNTTAGPLASGETNIATNFPVFGYTSKDRGGKPAGFTEATETAAEMPSVEFYINSHTVGSVLKNDVLIDETGVRFIIDTPNRTSFGFIANARIEKP